MRVTVAICTWNRAKLLDRTLAEMHELHIPSGTDWEIVVVNNACEDNTDNVLASHARTLPLRRLYEPRPGQSNARNCAIEASQGELILWTDDDVLVGPQWLSEYVRAAFDFPAASFFGGVVEPWFEVVPPRWIERHLSEIIEVYALTLREGIVRPARPQEPIVGANMAFRTRILREVLFDPNLGVVKDDAVRGDETDVIQRLRLAGHQGLWVGTASVRHFVPRQRLTRSYIRKWYIGKGRGFVRKTPVAQIDDRKLLGAPRWLLRQYAQELAKCWLWSSVGNDRWFTAFRQAALLRGFIQETRKGHYCAD